MRTPLKVVVHALTGLALGLSIVVIGVVATIALAVATGSRVGIPGVFVAWMEPYQGAPSLSFVPDGVGIPVAVAVVAVLYCASALALTAALSRRAS
jgi:hypothetical protein